MHYCLGFQLGVGFLFGLPGLAAEGLRCSGGIAGGGSWKGQAARAFLTVGGP